MYKLEIVVCLVENEASLAPRIKWNVDSSGLDQSIAQPLAPAAPVAEPTETGAVTGTPAP
jgi:hypothetical protein